MRTIALLLFLALNAYGATPGPKELFDRAKQLSASGDPAGGLRAYVEAVKVDPKLESWDFINHQGDAVGQRGLTLGADRDRTARAAAPYFQEALRLYLSRHPDAFTAAALLSQSYGFTDQLAEAERVWNAFRARNPRNVHAVWDADEILEAEGKYDDIVAAREQLSRFYPCDEVSRASVAGTILRLARHFPPERRRALLDRAVKNAREAVAMGGDIVYSTKTLIDALQEEAKVESSPARAASMNQEAATLELRWKELRDRQKEKRKLQRDWRLGVSQRSDDDPRIGFVESFPSSVLLRREPFEIIIEQKSDVPIHLSIAGDDKVPHAVPVTIPVSRTKRGLTTVLSYKVTSLGDLPIAGTKDCRVYVTATRGTDSMTVVVQPE